MKRYFVVCSSLFMLVCSVCSSCKQQSNDGVSSDLVNVPATISGKNIKPGDLPVFTFTEDSYDFGKITQGEKVSHAFTFTNTGGSDLVISSAQGSCGCTVPKYSKTPIAPNATGTIDVVFDSEGKSGKVQKTVTVVSNANPSTKVLVINVEILAPKN